MNDNFVEVISLKDNAFYPLRFIASDFFVPYWRYFIPPSIPDRFIPEIQRVARMCVDYFMDNGEIYWLIDFSERRVWKTWEIFEDNISKLPKDVVELVHQLSFQIAAPEDESDNADYFVGLISRLRFDGEYRKELGYFDQDVDILDVIHEYPADRQVILSDVRDKWLDADSVWDKKLKSQTPDLPESLYVIFSSAYNPNFNLILLHDNLHAILSEHDEYNDFVDRLKKVFIASLPKGAKIEFPRLMET